MVVAIEGELPTTAALAVVRASNRRTVASSIGAADRMAALYRAGVSISEIARRVDFAYSVVHRTIDEKVGVRRQPKLPVEATAAIAERYRAGATVDGLATDFSVSNTTIRAHLRAAGVPIRPRGFGTEPEVVDRMIALYTEGHTLDRVAELTHASPTGVASALRRRGVKTRRPGGSRPGTQGLALQPELERQVVELYERGRSMRQIAEQLPLSSTAVRGVLVRHGVPIRPPYITYTVVQRVPDEWLRNVVELYESGLTVEQVAERIGRTYNTAHHHLQRAGVLRTHALPEHVREEIIRLRKAEGLIYREIAARCDVSVSTVCRVLTGKSRPREEGPAGGERVPGEPLRRWLRDVIGPLGITEVARRARIDESRLRKIAEGSEYDRVSIGFVDRLVTRLGRPEVLASLYPQA